MNKINRCLFVILVLLIVINIPILSLAADQAEEEEEEVYEEEYVVTATRIPQSLGEAPGMTEIINGDDVDKGISTVSEVLEEKGFRIKTNGGESSVARPQMDGVDDSRLQFVLNGVPINYDRTGCVDLSYFPTAGIERIEIAHGPLSALYGANALGGVVNIITDLTGETGNTLSMSTGSFGSQRWGAAVEREKFGLALGGNVSNGHRSYSENEGTYFSGQYDFIQTEDEYLVVRDNYMTKDSQQPGPIDSIFKGDQVDERLMIDLSAKSK